MTHCPGPTPAALYRVPHKTQASYLAAQLIYAQGSKSERDLFAAVDFGPKPHLRIAALERAVQTGWLRRLPDMRIALTDFAVDYFDTEPEPPKPKGEIAGPRVINMLQRKAWVPVKRLVRADAPDCSVKAWPSTYARSE